jgi:hypothetical protein
MKFRSIIAEQLLLMEDVAKAEKLLKQYSIPLDNPDYSELKQKMAQDNAIGFLGIVMNVVFDRFKIELTAIDQSRNQSNIKTVFAVCGHIYSKIMNNRNDLNFLPKPLSQYTELVYLERDLNNIPKLKLTKRFANLIIDKNLKAQVIEKSLNNNDLKYYFENIDGTPDAKTFKQKLNRYKTYDEIVKYLETYINFHRNDFNYEKIMKKVNERGDLKVLYNKDEKVLVHVTSHEGLKAIGSPSWCIYNSGDNYNNYTKGGLYNQYVFFNFDETVYSEYSMIGFTMDGTRITASHLMNDDHIDDVMGYLNNIGVYPKIKAINTEIENIKKNRGAVSSELNYMRTIPHDDNLSGSEKSGEYHQSIENILKAIVGNDYYSNFLEEEFIEQLRYHKNFGNLIQKYSEIFGDFFGQSLYIDDNLLITRLTNVINFMQNYVYMRFEDQWDEDDSITRVLKVAKNVNLLEPDFFSPFPYHVFMKNAFKKVFVNFKNMDEKTYASLLYRLKEMKLSEDEVLNLIRLRKTKHGGDYSNTEFHRIKNKTDLSSNVLNKIQRARRGEEVEITYQEVEYGVKKGLKSSLVNYYRTILPQFMEQQVDLDDARIYQILGLSGELKKVVKEKYYEMGGDQNPNSINSIERSILDIG